jgi:Protein of unknown function (DUF3073)
MGRGRAKAKQTKVARELKYNSSPNWDPSRLEGELRGNGHAPVSNVSDDDEYVDPYAADPDEDDTAPPRHG